MYEYNYLMHWGIKGMKWGLRRYQNPDGTLTEAGKLRYAEQEARAAAKEQRRAEKAQKASEQRIAKAAHGNASKHLLNKMTDDELKAVNERLKMEQSYKDMMAKINPGSQQFFKWKEVAAKVSSTLITSIANKGIEHLTTKMFEKDDPQDAELKRLQRERDILGAKVSIRDYQDKLSGKTPKETAEQELKRIIAEDKLKETYAKRAADAKAAEDAADAASERAMKIRLKEDARGVGSTKLSQFGVLPQKLGFTKEKGFDEFYEKKKKEK